MSELGSFENLVRQQRLIHLDAGVLALHVAGVLFDGTNIYVGTNQGLLVSSNGGSTFSLSSVTGIPAGQAIVSFAGAKEGGAVRLFAVTAAPPSVMPPVEARNTKLSVALPMAPSTVNDAAVRSTACAPAPPVVIDTFVVFNPLLSTT